MLFKKKKQKEIKELAIELKKKCTELRCENCPFQNKADNGIWECYLGATDKGGIEWKPRMWVIH